MAKAGDREFVDARMEERMRVDVAQVIKSLRLLGPEYRKAFWAEIEEAVQPAIEDARAGYPEMPLSGMRRAWTPKTKGGYSSAGLKAFPWSVAKVRRGIKVKADTRRNADAVIYISQSNPAGRQYELAKWEHGRLGPQIIAAGHQRVLWPAVDRHRPQIDAAVAVAIEKAVAVVADGLPQAGSEADRASASRAAKRRRRARR